MDACLEAFGWFGSALVILSLVLADQRQFRLWNLIGSFIATAYNIVLGIWPAVAMNGLIVMIDLYWLLRLHGENRELQKKESISPAKHNDQLHVRAQPDTAAT